MKRNASRRTCWTDRLEARRLMSAALVDGTLTVVGTNAGDSIVIYASPPSAVGFYVVSIRAAKDNAPVEEVRVPVEGVTSVSVRALAGDDTVRLDALGEAGQDVRVPSRIDAGPGHDIVVGTVAGDFIKGGFGNDLLVGKAGDDRLDGGWGIDDLRGGDGNDSLEGGFGPDYVYGEAGDDRLSGGFGNDQVGYPGSAADGTPTPEPGNDLLIGGIGNDWMNGGAGSDRVFGGAGRDHFSALDAGPAEVRDRAPTEPEDVPTPDGRGYRTFAFRGTVTSVGTPGGSGGADGPIQLPQVGAQFRGTYTFNPVAPDSGMDRYSGVYTTAANGPVTVEIGDFHWAGPSSVIVTHDGPAGDIYEAGDWIPGLTLVNHPEVAALLDRWHVSLRIDGDRFLLPDYRLPMSPPSLEHATTATLTLTGDNGMSTAPGPALVITTTLDALTLEPTPGT
jgi:hypothetical protein